MKKHDKRKNLREENPFGFRFRLTFFVTLEMLICLLTSHFINNLIEKFVKVQWPFPLELEQIIVCLLVGIVATSQLSKYFLHPIKKVSSAMKRVSNGDYTVQLTSRSRMKEVKEINSGFNLMVQQLQTTEILQTDFVSNVSHEFKTPISAIEGYSTLLQDGDNLTPEQKIYVEKILFNTQRLSSLMGSILLLSKLENQQISTGKTNYRLDEQIRQAIVALEDAWDQKYINIDADLARVYYTGNEAMMHHIWANLLSNAIKFSPDNGTITMLLQQTDDKIIFTIDDQGPGLSDEAQKHIYDKFYQADGSHKQEGHGLGLTLVKRILSIEGGSISCENLPENGCRFTVILFS